MKISLLINNGTLYGEIWGLKYPKSLLFIFLGIFWFKKNKNKNGRRTGRDVMTSLRSSQSIEMSGSHLFSAYFYGKRLPTLDGSRACQSAKEVQEPLGSGRRGVRNLPVRRQVIKEILLPDHLSQQKYSHRVIIAFNLFYACLLSWSAVCKNRIGLDGSLSFLLFVWTSG